MASVANTVRRTRPLRASEDAAPGRILVACTRRIGDVLLATPFVRSLKRAWPGATIDFLAFAGTESALEGNPDVSRVITVGERDGTGARLSSLRALWRGYDLACSTQTSDRTTLYAWAAGRRVTGLLDPARAPWWKRALLDAWEPFDDLNVHTVVADLALCESLGIEKCYEVVVPQGPRTSQEVAAGLQLGAGAESYAVLHVSPRFPYKSWTVDGWRALAARLLDLGVRPVICAGGAADERNLAARVIADLPAGAVDAAGRLSLPDLAALIAAAKVSVGTDTAVTHLAAATGVPTVALFGPSNPVKWGPWPRGCTTAPSPWTMRGTQRRGNVTLVQGEGACVPCLLEGCDRHVASLSRCLQEMFPRTVIAEVERVLGTRTPLA
ncbi:MAG: LPS core biosynthesis protein [Betaproteobacteria bacterium]|nr:LPS core biosynthesis protein [Betaproteobacteria bacterium]